MTIKPNTPKANKTYHSVDLSKDFNKIMSLSMKAHKLISVEELLVQILSF